MSWRLLLLYTTVIFFLSAVSAYGQSHYIIHHFTNENGLPANGVKGIELDKKTGFVWVGTQAGLVRFDGIHFENFTLDKHASAASRITAIIKDSTGVIYCEDDNLSVYRITNDKPEFIMTDTFDVFPAKPVSVIEDSLKKLLPNAEISSAQIWKEQGVIFLGSEVNGLYVLKAPFLQSVRKAPDRVTGRVEYAQAEITPGIVNTASDLSFSSQGKLLPGKTGLAFLHGNIYRDQQNNYWYSSEDTIFHFYPHNHRQTTIALGDRSVRIIFGETKGRQYVISNTLIADITGDRYRVLYKLPHSAIQLKTLFDPTAVVEWKPGILAIAVGKLVFFDTEKKRIPDTIAVPGLTTKVRSLLKYKDYLLIGTYGQGIYIYKNGKIKKMPLDRNGYLSFAHCFMPDDNGFCWISTNRGLFKVNLDALIAAYEEDLPEIYYHYFGKDDGMVNTELNGGCQPCALKLSNGLFSFPSMNGMVVFDPQQEHSPPPAGTIFIEEVLADSASYQTGDNFLTALPYDLKTLRLKLALPQFGNPENIYFSYKLDPYNDQWETQDIVQNNILQFGGLKPGSYKLYLRVRNGFGPDQFDITTFEFRILKPWYQQWWFYLLCFLVFLSITKGWVKWRTASIAKRKEELQQLVAAQTRNLAVQGKQLEAQLRQLKSQQARLEEDNKIKARLIAIISHDMIGPLKFMGFISKKLRDAFSPSDPSYGTADTMLTTMQELESLSLNMLNWVRFHYNPNTMKPERFNLRDLVNESTEIASTLANEKGLKLNNDIPPGMYVWQYRQAVNVIVYNLAMNALKYTEIGEIRITAWPSGNYFFLAVSDTGKGMSPELVDMLNNQEFFISASAAGDKKKFQFGYAIIKDLLQLVRGKMKVQSVLNAGTQVTVELMLPEEETIPGN